MRHCAVAHAQDDEIVRRNDACCPGAQLLRCLAERSTPSFISTLPAVAGPSCLMYSRHVTGGAGRGDHQLQ